MIGGEVIVAQNSVQVCEAKPGLSAGDRRIELKTTEADDVLSSQHTVLCVRPANPLHLRLQFKITETRDRNAFQHCRLAVRPSAGLWSTLLVNDSRSTCPVVVSAELSTRQVCEAKPGLSAGDRRIELKTTEADDVLSSQHTVLCVRPANPLHLRLQFKITETRDRNAFQHCRLAVRPSAGLWSTLLVNTGATIVGRHVQ
ncbi:hypothetical protein EGW08_022113 [Elysia chlorotica]|uniref:Uncharacterized protein n=1 Tax=Elysia chlorotica TaxID=188477 RepID=A0A3S0Z634_ELYCH|nr:hypothetical protein EGW08_022113 [Elysia chlorotica]